MRLSGEALEKRVKGLPVWNIEIRFSLKEKLEYGVCKWFSVFVMRSDPDEVSSTYYDAGSEDSERVSQKDLEFGWNFLIIFQAETKKTKVDCITPGYRVDFSVWFYPIEVINNNTL